MNILFLDIDGVVNCQSTTQRHRGFIGIDPYMAFLVGNLVDRLGLKVVISSSWRHTQDGLDEIAKQVCKYIDVTPSMPISGGAEACERGKEIKAWLDVHPIIKCDSPTSCPPPTRRMCCGHAIENYAILDDDNDMLPEQQSHFFKTTWLRGIDEGIIKDIERHFGYPQAGVAK